MICDKCGLEWSDSIYPMHKKRCIGKIKVEKKKEDKEIKLLVGNPDIDKEEPKKEIDIQKGLIMAELDEREIKYDSRKSAKNLLKVLNKAKEEAE